MEGQLTSADLEALDPTPDIHALFAYYNELYFNSKLGACSVEWSTKRMTMCAGICCYSRTSGCRIKLSEPLLKFRPTKDLKETLLHEMIHAELFLDGVKNDGDHGPVFRSRMTAINTARCTDHQRPVDGYKITVYHTMHDEVNLYRTHVWSCDRCGNTVKRSMNRQPQEADCRSFSKAAAAAAVAQGQPGSYCKDPRCYYHQHVKHCGGSYIKISEPEKSQAANKAATGSSTQQQASSSTGSNKRLKPPAAAAAAGTQPIEAFFKRKDGQQQQQQEQQKEAVGLSQDSRPPGQQESQAVPAQQGGQQKQHVDQPEPPPPPQQQQQSSGDYWASLGKGKTLGGATGQLVIRKSWGSRSSSPSAAAAKGQHLASGSLPGSHSTQGVDQQQQSEQLPLSDLRLSQNRQQYQQQLGSKASVVPQGKQHQQQQQSNKGSLLPTLQQQQQQQQHRVATAARSLQEAVDVVELLSSDDEDDTADVRAGTAAAAAAMRVPRCVAADSNSGRDAGQNNSMLGAGGSSGGGGAAAALVCPVCCQEWSPGEISNAQLNAHLDECLARMH